MATIEGIDRVCSCGESCLTLEAATGGCWSRCPNCKREKFHSGASNRIELTGALEIMGADEAGDQEPEGDVDQGGEEPAEEPAAVEAGDQGAEDQGDAIDRDRFRHAEETRRSLEQAAHEAETEEELDRARAEDPEFAERLDAAREAADEAEEYDADDGTE